MPDARRKVTGREYDERLKDWKKNPLHDWTSHAADALRYFVLGFEESHN
jgi:hypothetical protein